MVLASRDPILNGVSESIEVYVDNQAAIINCNKYKTGLNFRDIKSIDLLIQSGFALHSFNLHWVKVHDGNIGNTLADMLCNARGLFTPHELDYKAHKLANMIVTFNEKELHFLFVCCVGEGVELTKQIKLS